MSDKSLAERMQLKPGRTLWIVNAPKGYRDLIAPPDGAKVVACTTRPVDIIQVFVRSQQEAESRLRELKGKLAPGGLIWVTYPKLTSALRGYINRDTIWRMAPSVGLEAVAQIAVD